jgi:uncharacterized protein (DUF58 family)
MYPALRHRLERWLFRLHRKEAVPIVLDRRRVFVLPTGPGYVFGVTLLLMLVGSINYALNLGHALTFLLAGVGLSTLVHTFRNLVSLAIQPLRGESAFAGEPVRFLLRLRNPSSHPRRRLCLTLPGEMPVWTDVPALGELIVSLPHATIRRGPLPLSRLTLETRYPLGLVRAWAYAEAELQAMVWPKPEADAPPFPVAGGDASGARSGREGMDDFAGLRSHRHGEAPRHIAWRAVARRQDDAPLLSKRFEGQAAGELCLDWSDLPTHLDTEERLSRLAAWVLRAQAEGRHWRLTLPDGTLPTDSGEAHLRRCLDRLALFGGPSP